MRRSLPLFLAIGVALIAASPALAEQTREQYIGAADSICLNSLEAQNQALKGFTSDVKHGQVKKAAGKVRRAGVAFSQGVDGLAAIEQPPADASLLGSWIQSLRAQVPLVNGLARSLSHRNVKQLRRYAVRLETASAQSQALVRDYGFGVCSSF